MEVDVGDRHWLFEIKYARPHDDVEAMLESALEQMRSRRYGESARQKVLIRAGLVFSGKERRFVAWKCLDES